MKRDLYQVLQIHPRADSEVIEAAYKALIKMHHPDLVKTVGNNAKNLNEAHDILGDPIKRKEYDNSQTPDVSKMIGPYKIIELIAEGGFGRTYKAQHTALGSLSCIKDCSNVSLSDTEVLIDEAKVLWDLRHYALPAMRDLYKLEDGRVLLVMSYVPGLTIEKLIKKSGKLDVEHVAWITERLINALNYLHRNGVVHGDIKPQNAIIQADTHMAVLVDFGLSAVKPTSKDEAKGYTPFFAPPESIGGKPLIPESDYYSLGMTMIYMLSGGPEYVARKEVPSDVPPELCNFIKKLIARDVNSRPQYGKDDLGDMIIDLRKKIFGRASSGLKPINGV